SVSQNVEAVIRDILRDGNSNCMLPGQIEAEAAKQSDRWGGLLFTDAEIDAFNAIARECGQPEWNKHELSRAG
ncbi:MAG TPA: lactate dehydrogenase, partial [Opitutales bacterium]|nr:lactate dehydrogenase [Opitutales bacterium]